MGDVLQLGQPIASGGGRLVFQHPTQPELLVKTLKKPLRPGHAGMMARPLKRKFGDLREWHVEYVHYIALMARTGRCPDYIARYYGFTETTSGLGQLVERIGNGEALALTLKDYLASPSRSPSIRETVVQFLQSIGRDGAVFRDLTTTNICIVRNASGEPIKAVAVDGFGDFTLIPIRRYSRTAYNVWHSKVTRRLLKAVDAALT